MQKFLNNFQVAVLGLNPWVMFKQPVSMLASVPELGDFDIFSGEYLAPAFKMLGTSMLKVQLNPKDMKFGELDLNNPTIIEMMDLMPMIKQRFKGYIDREMGEFTQAKENPYAKSGKKTKIPFLGEIDRKEPIGSIGYYLEEGTKVASDSTVASSVKEFANRGDIKLFENSYGSYFFWQSGKR